jgi:L-fucose mutarotase
MLKGVPALVGPELLFAVSRMGHGDVLAVVDTNFPSYSLGPAVLRLDGVNLPDALDAVLTLFPLDTFIDDPIARMAVVGDETSVPEVATDAIAVLRAHDRRPLMPLALSRHDFYDAARGAFAILATGESRPYGCFLLTKGIVPEFAPPPED